MSKDVKKIIQSKYADAAKGESSCCSNLGSYVNNSERISKSIGYSDEEINNVPEANMGLGCGNPTAFGEIAAGETVLDLGSGAGLDCFLAANKTGETGKVIGLDMTQEMIDKARHNAEKHNYKNVEFILGEIENMPVESGSIDVIMSNCVINLVPCKKKAFKEAYRVLKSGGRMYVSDIVLVGSLTEEQKNDEELICGCVAGAVLKDKYLGFLAEAGFQVEIIQEDSEIGEKQYNNLPVMSLKYKAVKP